MSGFAKLTLWRRLKAVDMARAMRLFFVLAFVLQHIGWSAEQLLSEPEPSPDGERAANVEWESLSQVGCLRIKIYSKARQILGSVEVPQIRPDPGELEWIDNRWVVCESFLGERASAFFYVDALELRGYLLEIFALREGSDWDFDVRYVDSGTTLTVSNISRGQACLFPIVLGVVPSSEEAYFSPEFCQKFVKAVDEYRQWLRKRSISNFTLVGRADVRPGLGGIAAALSNGHPTLLWFPLGSRVPADVLATARLVPLSDTLTNEFLVHSRGIEARWLGQENASTWRYVINRRAADDDATSPSAPRTLWQGQLSGVQDKLPAALLEPDERFTSASVTLGKHTAQNSGDKNRRQKKASETSKLRSKTSTKKR
jgi:hypothetical protein